MEPKFKPAPVPGSSAWDTRTLVAQNKLAVESKKNPTLTTINNPHQPQPWALERDHRRAPREGRNGFSRARKVNCKLGSTTPGKQRAIGQGDSGRKWDGRAPLHQHAKWENQLVPMVLGPYHAAEAYWAARSIGAAYGNVTYPLLLQQVGSNLGDFGTLYSQQDAYSDQQLRSETFYPHNSNIPYVSTTSSPEQAPSDLPLTASTNTWTTDPVLLGATHASHFPLHTPYSMSPKTETAQLYQTGSAGMMTLEAAIKKQILYYFSVENLCKDRFLRKLFDPETGGVPLREIAKFKRLALLSGQNTGLIKRVIEEECADTLEVLLVKDEDAVRVDKWQRWIL